jgi:hypothetical protein
LVLENPLKASAKEGRPTGRMQSVQQKAEEECEEPKVEERKAVTEGRKEF